jgi:hypothetical protein
MERLIAALHAKLDEEQAEIIVKGCICSNPECLAAWQDLGEDQDPYAPPEQAPFIPISQSLMEQLEDGVTHDAGHLAAADDLLQQLFRNDFYGHRTPFLEYFNFNQS